MSNDWIPLHHELGCDPEPVGTERFERLAAAIGPTRRRAAHPAPRHSHTLRRRGRRARTRERSLR